MNWQVILDALPVVLPAAAGGALVVVIVVAAARLTRRRPTHTDIAALRSDVAELAGQLEDYARQVDKQVEARLAQLQAMLNQADGKQADLRRLLDAAQLPPDSASTSRAIDGQVLALAAQGTDTIEIARRLQIDVGEVELILNLHRSNVSSKP